VDAAAWPLAIRLLGDLDNRPDRLLNLLANLRRQLDAHLRNIYFECFVQGGQEA
jgi:hypothetical protein